MTAPVDTTDPDDSRPTPAADHSADGLAPVRDERVEEDGDSDVLATAAAGAAGRGMDTAPAAVEADRGGAVQTAHALGPEPALARAGAREIAAAICPYLASAGGAWRMATPSRDHRCVGLQPPVPQPPEKQRRHCLSAAHVECGIYRAARDVRTVALAGAADPARIVQADAGRRPLPRTSPILLEPPRLLDQATRLRLDRAPGQLALAALMIVAFGVVGLSRLSATPSTQPSTGPSLIAVLPSSSLRPSPTATLRPSPSGPPFASASPSGPAASFRTTYTIKKGDTLNSVATRFKTTAAAITRLNNLKSSALRIGQVLKIP
jgi:LysM domain